MEQVDPVVRENAYTDGPPSPQSGVDRLASLQEDALLSNWEAYFRKYQKVDITDLALEYPDTKSLFVDWFEVDKHDRALAEELLKDPYRVMYAAEEALRSVDVPLETRPRLHFRVRSLPDDARVPIRDIRSEHLGTLIACAGLVKKATEVRPKVREAVFECQRCGAIIHEDQDEHLAFKEPLECYEDQNGCGRSTPMKLLEDRSDFVDTQKIEIQESPENLRGGDQPQRLVIYCDDDIVGQVSPGDRVTVNGVLRSTQRRSGGQKSTLFDIFLDCVSIELEEKEFEEVEITEEDEQRIEALSRDPELYQKMVHSIAPSIYGMEMEKLSLALQLFGGVTKTMPDGTRLRGDIHILLVGDPGVAKSQLLRYMSRIAPRGIYTSGKSTSAAGLTAAAVKDEFGEGRWTLEAGALVLADKGLCAIDEIDKMERTDRSAMHEAMEQQLISVAKAGITAQLQSRCAVLGAANPKFGRFEEYSPVPEQIDMPPALLSRFDVIFTISDKPEERRDTRLAEHILGVHYLGELKETRSHDPRSWVTEEMEDEATRSVDPPISPEFLRKYVAQAKRTVYPVMTEEAKHRLGGYYVDLRRQGGRDGPVPLTPRQLEAFVRLAEASARMRMSPYVEEDDADRAIQVVEYYLGQVAQEEGGIFDIDRITSGITHNQRSRMRVVMEAIRELEHETDHGAPRRRVVEEATREGLEPAKIEEVLDKLLTDGKVYSPDRPGHYRIV